MTEVYLLCYQATLPMFTSLNLLLQREWPIFLLQNELCSKFIICTALQTHHKLQAIPYVDKESHLLGNRLNVGFTTGVKRKQLVEVFHTAVLKFLMSVMEYALQRLPLSDPLLKHARFVDVRQRAECVVEEPYYLWRGPPSTVQHSTRI